jgi:hypothetical protein
MYKEEKQRARRTFRWAAAWLTSALAMAITLPAAAGVQKTSAEFGAYTEDALVYPNGTAQQYGEWSEYANLFDRSDWWGNSTFGAGYSTYGATGASKSANSASTSANAGLTTDVKIFGYNIDIVDIYTGAYTQMRPSYKSASFSVYVKGSQVYSASGSNQSWGWSQNLFSWNYSKTFYPGGYPVKVTAGVTGDASLYYRAGLEPTYMRAALTGRAGLYAQAKGEVGVSWLLGAAAWANLTLVEPVVNVNAVQAWEFQPSGGSCAVTFWKGSNAYMTLNSLKGNVKAQAQFFGGTETATIFSWPGFSTTYNLMPNNMTARVVTDNFGCPTVGG